MKTIKKLLQHADPLQREPTWPAGERDLRRQSVLAAVSRSRARAAVLSRSRIAVFATVIFLIIAGSLLASHVRSPFVSDLQGAVRFEVRLAEDKPDPGLREAKVSGSDRAVYLHDEVIVDNGDVESARIVQGTNSSHYSVEVKLKASGAEKMRAATGNHIGKLAAILLDGQVVMAPVIRSSIDASAVITGSFTKAEAQRIVNGISVQ